MSASLENFVSPRLDLDMIKAIKAAKQELGYDRQQDQITARIISRPGCIDRIEIIGSAI